jgi:hypothetical protein
MAKLNRFGYRLNRSASVPRGHSTGFVEHLVVKLLIDSRSERDCTVRWQHKLNAELFFGTLTPNQNTVFLAIFVLEVDFSDACQHQYQTAGIGVPIVYFDRCRTGRNLILAFAAELEGMAGSPFRI